MRDGKRLEIGYDGYSRVVEVHAVGYSTAGNPVMRAYQVRGGSNSGEQGWKMLRLDEISRSRILEERSEAPRTGYRRNDSQMARIICQL
jgi:hypothetical protein